MSDLPVLLSTEGESLQFEDEKQQSQFEIGVSSAVFLWDDLATAVANGWGGPESEEKREWLAGAIVELFDANEVGTDDVEFRLLAAMEDEFDVTLETNTALKVAQQIVQVYQEVAEKNYTLVEELLQRFKNRVPAKAVVVQDEDGEEDSGESEEDTPELVPADEEMEVEEPKNLVDEDGFQTVQRRRR